ncbi:MAG: hypothetical protein DRP78_01370 [Candidatus Omnitrophota bacterium]|nr:MAG: hypothetical protein DRP78_01370 [Candidatus Omnitrophota bacterium]
MNVQDKKGLIGWLVFGGLGLIVFVLFFSYAFPTASIDIKVSKADVLEKAAKFVQNEGFDLQGFDRTLVFGSDTNASIYLQKTQGIKRSNDLIEQGVPVWFWEVRWFKQLEKQGFYVDVDPVTGKVANFTYTLLDDAKGAHLSPRQAQTVAENKIKGQGIDLKNYELKQNTVKEQKNRTDHYFVWQKNDFAIGEANLRLAVSIYGDKLGHLRRYLKVPEEFMRSVEKELSLGQVLSMITMIFMFFLFVSALVVLLIKFKQDQINWKFGLIFGVSIVLLSIISFANSTPLLWFGYPDTMSKTMFLTIAAGSALIGALLLGSIISLFGCSGESLSREVWGEKMFLLNSFKEHKNLSYNKVFQPIIIGYCLGFVLLGYMTLFYFIGTKFFNIWMPPEVEYSNILGTSMPFLFPLTIALSAAVSEEFMFRLFAVSFLKKYLKSSYIAVFISALIWAFAHSNYPVFPAYIRGIELTIAGIIFGIVFLKYGIEAVVIAHFVIDAALVGLPLLKSHNLYFILSGLAVICLAFIPAIFLPMFARNARLIENIES